MTRFPLVPLSAAALLLLSAAASARAPPMHHHSHMRGAGEAAGGAAAAIHMHHDTTALTAAAAVESDKRARGSAAAAAAAKVCMSVCRPGALPGVPLTSHHASDTPRTRLDFLPCVPPIIHSHCPPPAPPFDPGPPITHPPQSTPIQGGPALLTACYEAGLAADGYTRDRFPFCAVLQPGAAVLYWDVVGDATATPPDDNSDGGATSEKKKEAAALPPPPVGATPGNGGVLTLGVVMRASAPDNDAAAASGSNTGGFASNSFFALGLSAEGQGMKGMDVAMLRQDSEASWVLEDRWAVDYSLPTLDASQDKTLLSAGSIQGAPGLVAWSFTMPLANCHDPGEDAPILPGRDTFVLWAQGQVDPETGEPLYHGPNDRGATRLPLRTAVAGGGDVGRAEVRWGESCSI